MAEHYEFTVANYRQKKLRKKLTLMNFIFLQPHNGTRLDFLLIWTEKVLYVIYPVFVSTVSISRIHRKFIFFKVFRMNELKAEIGYCV